MGLVFIHLTTKFHYEGLWILCWNTCYYVSSVAWSWWRNCLYVYLVWWCVLFLHFLLSWLILVVDRSSTVDSVRLCTLHIGPSPPWQTQAKGTAVHYLKRIQATSAFSNCQHKYINVYIFQCYADSNCLPVAPEFCLVCPNHCFFFCFLTFASSIHHYFSLLFRLIPPQLHLLSLSAIQKQLVNVQHVIPNPQFWWCM